MNRYLILLCICSIVMLVSVVAAEENVTPTPTEIKTPKDTPTPTPTLTLKPDKLEKPDIKPVKYTEKATIIDVIITTFSDILGFQQETKTKTVEEVLVEVDGKTIAVIPKGSTFNGLVIHEECLAEGYGTDRWYSCEVFFQ